MWSSRTIAAATALAILAAACAGLRSGDSPLESQVAGVLERRGLGTEALLVIDNLLRNGPPAPRAAPPLVLELLARPLDAVHASRIFQAAVPAPLASLDASPSAAAFEDLLKTYVEAPAEAQRLLRAAVREFAEEDFTQGLPSPRQLLAAADAIDALQLERANQAFISATAAFVAGIRSARDLPAGPRRFVSAIGTVAIGTRGNDRHGADAALIIDPGGDDVYERAPARGGAVSVIIDLGGNDEYRGNDLVLRGFSAIVDLAGDDRYAMESGLGAALAGTALVLDYSGNDRYQAKSFAQGAAALGIGALIDFGGDDRYSLGAWGQGLGIAGGVGLLWDRSGDDHYMAAGVPDALERSSGLSGAQGAGFGYRERIAGGIGILRDDAGDDLYDAQMFAQGIGYYYGLGLLWDRGGADRYEAFRYAQGNGVHQALGVLRDEAGDDQYAIGNVYGQGMGLDVAVGVLLDGGGSDVYRARAVAQGAATANGFGLLADESGADRFSLEDSRNAWGRAEWLRGLPSVGVLLHGSSAQFTRGGASVPAPPEDPPVTVQPSTPQTCPSNDPGEALVCRVRDAPDPAAVWRELQALLIADPQTPLAGWIAIALAERPPGNAGQIAALLAKRESCNARALALRAWPTLPEATAAVRSDCFRLQSAGRAAFARLGAPLPRDAALPAFLRRIPPQQDTH